MVLRMQPFYVFKAEVVRINDLYWSSSLAFDNYSEMLGVLSVAGICSGDVTVDKLWGSKELGRFRAFTVPLSEFLKSMGKNCEYLRAMAIIQICSAFENALCGYYSLCCLYDGGKHDSSYSGLSVPALLGSSSAFEARRDSINKKIINPPPPSKPALHGKYSNRINRICQVWGLGRLRSR